jgi:hypothetical protein
LNYGNVSLVRWVLLLMETYESQIMIFEKNAVWSISGFHMA